MALAACGGGRRRRERDALRQSLSAAMRPDQASDCAPVSPEPQRSLNIAGDHEGAGSNAQLDNSTQRPLDVDGSSVSGGARVGSEVQSTAVEAPVTDISSSSSVTASPASPPQYLRSWRKNLCAQLWTSTMRGGIDAGGA